MLIKSAAALNGMTKCFIIRAGSAEERCPADGKWVEVGTKAPVRDLLLKQKLIPTALTLLGAYQTLR